MGQGPPRNTISITIAGGCETKEQSEGTARDSRRFRYFLDYGRPDDDWGSPLVEFRSPCFDEVSYLDRRGSGDKYYVKDNVDAPDTMLATLPYPKVLASYESRTGNPRPMFSTTKATERLAHGTDAS